MSSNLLLLSLLVLAGQSAWATSQWYVSLRGNDTNPGTKHRPFLTPARALDISRLEPKAASRRVVLEDGTYFDVALQLGPQDAGLTIAARTGSNPILCGGHELSGFQPEGPRFWTAALPDGASADIRLLVVNGRVAERARYPETGRLTHLSEFKVPWMGTFGGGWKRKPTAEELTTMRVKAEDVGQYFEATNAEVTIYHEWDESTLGVQSYDPTTGVIMFTKPSGHPPGAFGNHDYVIWNTRDGLTRPGQWYVDRTRRRVVYWPLPTESPNRLQAKFPTAETIIRISGPADTPVRNLTIEGLTLELANTPLKTGGFGAYAFDGAISADHIVDCHFRQLTVRQVAGQGIKLSHSMRCEIGRCRLSECGAGGVVAGGSNLVLSQNEIEYVGRIYRSAIALSCQGDDDAVLNNEIKYAPYVGLTCDGYRARIEGNRIADVMQELHDGAAIYLGGTNHLIRSNFCFRIGQTAAERRHAYYMDEHVRDCRLEMNLALDCASPLHNHMATNNTIVNNVFVNHGDLRLSFFRCAHHRLERNVIWASGKIEVFGPQAIDLWTNNICYSRTGQCLAVSLNDYTPIDPAPLKANGIFTQADPGIQVKEDGAVTWPKNSFARQLSIRPFQLRQ
ncbi:MAG TPA: right-handed parallel beta-helix repeat-containing protein [Candidatus Limnocylindrales bacterium]|nr:right-handed parallel beta-helix repeat-containing protein [Candidatus Limnocylindrales bacterium]